MFNSSQRGRCIEYCDLIFKFIVLLYIDYQFLTQTYMYIVITSVYRKAFPWSTTW